MKLLDGCLGDFWANIVAGRFGAQTLSHREFKARGAPKFFGEEDPIASPYSKGSKVGVASCLQGDRFHNWIVFEVSHTLQEELTGIIVRNSDRLVAKFKDQISSVKATDKIIG